MYVLGISGPLGHDSSACLMRDGHIISMVEEERLSRKPHSPGGRMPYLAIENCLFSEGITLDEVDYIVLSWDQKLITKEKIQMPEFFNDYNALFPKKYFKYKRLPKVEIVDHHLAHAASTFYFSDFNEASVLVVDGAGEDCSTTLYHGVNNMLKTISSIHHNESLGEFYSSATTFLGFDWTDAGKTMGLAPYGEPVYDFPRIKLDNEAGYKINIAHTIHMAQVEKIWEREFIRMGIMPNTLERSYDSTFYKHSNHLEFSKEYRNFAASAQKVVEDCYCNLVKVLVEKTNCKNLCLAGGVALNCTANGKLSRTGLVDDIFIQPAAYDAGAAIGAAAEVMVRLGYKIEPIKNVYKGASFTNDQIISTVKRLGLKYSVSDDITETASDLLVQGNSIGWFQGAAEYGPRALGNRSMIADPSIPGIRDHMNNVVKLRESFRPFGPSVLEDKANEWFEDMKPSRYMLKAAQVRSEKKEKIAGAVHVDGSSRPQTVTLESNEKYYNLIEQFYKKTGIPMILNTSFNLRGEPMVFTPYDAIRTFYTSALDVLVMNDIYIRKL